MRCDICLFLFTFSATTLGRHFLYDTYNQKLRHYLREEVEAAEQLHHQGTKNLKTFSRPDSSPSFHIIYENARLDVDIAGQVLTVRQHDRVFLQCYLTQHVLHVPLCIMGAEVSTRTLREGLIEGGGGGALLCTSGATLYAETAISKSNESWMDHANQGGLCDDT
jgi:hypothetical protein